MAKDPVLSIIIKFLEAQQGIAGIKGQGFFGSCGKQTFYTARRESILMVIQKTADVEPVSPAQHLLFGKLKISYRKRDKCSYQGVLIIVIFFVSGRIVEHIHFFKILIHRKVIFVAFACFFTWRTATTCGFLTF